MAWLYKRPGTARWWIGWRVNGKLFAKSTGTEDRAEAEKKLAEIETLQQWKAAGRLTRDFVESLTGPSQSGKPVSVRGELDGWLAETKGGAAASTLRRYSEIGEAFAVFLNATPKGPMMGDIDIETVRGFLTSQRANKTASTTNLWRTILSIFFGRAVKNGVIRTNPVAAVKMFRAGKDEETSRRSFTLQELQLLHQRAPSDFWRYMILGGFFTGLRLGDLATMRWGNVDFGANAIRIQPRKTRKNPKTLFIPLRKPLRDALEAKARQNRTTPAKEPIWPAEAAEYEAHGATEFSQQFTEILAMCGLATKRLNKQGTGKGRNAKREQGLSFHCLRHSFVTTLAVLDGSKSVAKELAGHSSDLVSDLYTHMPVESLTAAIEKLPDITG